jgi:hypothetical protein
MHPVTRAGVLSRIADELAFLSGLIRELAGDSCNAVPIEGERGIGKTSVGRGPLHGYVGGPPCPSGRPG